MRLSIMMAICIKEHIMNIWSSMHEKKLSNNEAELKKALLMKKACNTPNLQWFERLKDCLGSCIDKNSELNIFLLSNCFIWLYLSSFRVAFYFSFLLCRLLSVISIALSIWRMNKDIPSCGEVPNQILQ